MWGTYAQMFKKVLDILSLYENKTAKSLQQGGAYDHFFSKSLYFDFFNNFSSTKL